VKNTLNKIMVQLKVVIILMTILNAVLIFGLFKQSNVKVQADYAVSTLSVKSCRDVNIKSISGVPIYGGAIPVKIVK